MLSHWAVRVSGVALGCLALLVLVAPTFGQEGSDKKGSDKKGSDKKGRSVNTYGLQFSTDSSVGTSGSASRGKAKFTELLANRDLSHFRGYKQQSVDPGWTMAGKHLHFSGTGGDIITKEEYENFELQADWKVSEGGNSGIIYRVSLGDSAPYISGIEYQVLDNEKHSDGKNELTSAASVYGLYAPGQKVARKAGVWNKTRLIVNGNKITHYLNGRKVVEAEIGSDDWNKRVDSSKFKDWEKFGKNTKGHIAFQAHGDEVRYRNIRIKRLPSSSAVSTGSGAKGSASRGAGLSASAAATAGSAKKGSDKKGSDKKGTDKKGSASKDSELYKALQLQSGVPGTNATGSKSKSSSKKRGTSSLTPSSSISSQSGSAGSSKKKDGSGSK